jgi:hypothetical protein
MQAWALISEGIWTVVAGANYRDSALCALCLWSCNLKHYAFTETSDLFNVTSVSGFPIWHNQELQHRTLAEICMLLRVSCIVRYGAKLLYLEPWIYQQQKRGIQLALKICGDSPCIQKLAEQQR